MSNLFAMRADLSSPEMKQWQNEYLQVKSLLRNYTILLVPFATVFVSAFALIIVSCNCDRHVIMWISLFLCIETGRSFQTCNKILVTSGHRLRDVHRDSFLLLHRDELCQGGGNLFCQGKQLLFSTFHVIFVTPQLHKDNNNAFHVSVFFVFLILWTTDWDLWLNSLHSVEAVDNRDWADKFWRKNGNCGQPSKSQDPKCHCWVRNIPLSSCNIIKYIH